MGLVITCAGLAIAAAWLEIADKLESVRKEMQDFRRSLPKANIGSQSTCDRLLRIVEGLRKELDCELKNGTQLAKDLAASLAWRNKFRDELDKCAEERDRLRDENVSLKNTIDNWKHNEMS